MKIVTIVLVIFMATGAVVAQNGTNSPVEGGVFDSDGNPVEGAEVKVISEAYPEKVYKGNTGSDGRFSFNVPQGNGKISASKNEGGVTRYSEPRDMVFVIHRTTEVNLVLTLSGGVSERVDIATGVTQPFSEVSKTVDTISGNEFRDRNENSLVDALRSVPGFRIQQLGGFGRTASIKTRGLRNQDTAILLNGQRLRDPTAITGDASPFISEVSSVNTGRIEILRGSGSSIYGTNAIGGVIDLSTARAGRGIHGSFTSEGGGLGYTRFFGDAAFGTNDGRFGATAGISRNGVTRGVDGADDADNTSFNTRFDGKPTERLSLTGSLFVSDGYVRLNSNPDTVGAQPPGQIIDAIEGVNFVADINDPDNFQRSDFIAGQVTASYLINSKTVFSAGYKGLKTSRENENGGLGPGFQPFGGTQFSLFDGSIHTIDAKVDWTVSTSSRLIAGYEYEVEEYANEGIGPTSAADFLTSVDQEGSTFYAQYLHSAFKRRLQFAGGFRAQSFSLSTPVFSVTNAPYAGFQSSDPPAAYTLDGAISYFLPGTDTKFRFHAGNGYRVPSLYERFGSFFSSFSGAFTAIGDPGLEPERSIAIDAGIDQVLADGRLTLSGTYFYTKLTDTIGYGNFAPPIGSTARPFGGYLNTEGGIARGVEFSASVSPLDGLSIFSSYTYTNSDQNSPQVAGSTVLRTLGIPDHRFTLNLTQRIARRLTMNFDFEASSSYLVPIFSSSSFSTVIYRFDGNRKGDLTASYLLPILGEKANLRFFGTIENLFDYEYFENGFRTAGRTARGGIGIRF
ncbi:MAG: TonB-dependent receptor [Pyrinomonadaceae bacterium]|nr:TonB-dependent receptor [Pyrinomonadaceae bacterium]